MEAARPSEGKETVFRYSEINLMLLALRKVFSIRNLPTHYTLGKRAETPVVCLFDVVRETAGGQFLHAQMILDTFTTCSLA
jgi:hypothetical protein